MIKLELDVRTAAAIRQVLYKEQEGYTYDPTCIPQRIVDIRETIGTLDTQIESSLEEAAKEIRELETEAAPDYGVGK